MLMGTYLYHLDGMVSWRRGIKWENDIVNITEGDYIYLFSTDAFPIKIAGHCLVVEDVHIKNRPQALQEVL